MRFRLTFDGDLHSSQRAENRLPGIWNIRRALHPQLAQLWDTHPTLNEAPLGPALRSTQDALKEPITVNGFDFRPLVRKSLSLVCRLDILFMRQEEPGSIVLQGGDLDNRIKSLFDALRIPKKEEFVMDCGPTGQEQPFFCLLEDDALITDYRIRSDRLLHGGDTQSVHAVHLVIQARTLVTKLTWANAGFLGD
jgi:hypothetical protein